MFIAASEWCEADLIVEEECGRRINVHEVSIKARELSSKYASSNHGVRCGDHLQVSSPTLLCLHLQGRVKWEQPHGNVQRGPICDEDLVRQRFGGEDNRISLSGEVLAPAVHDEGVHQHPPRPHLELQGQEHSGGGLRQVRWHSLR